MSASCCKHIQTNARSFSFLFLFFFFSFSLLFLFFFSSFSFLFLVFTVCLQIVVIIDPMPYDVRVNEYVIKLSIYLHIVDTKVNKCLSSSSYLAMGRGSLNPIPHCLYFANGKRLAKSNPPLLLLCEWEEAR